MANGLLVSYAGSPYAFSSLFPDNGLASLAAVLRAEGHECAVWDLNTAETMARDGRRVAPRRSRAGLRSLGRVPGRPADGGPPARVGVARTEPQLAPVRRRLPAGAARSRRSGRPGAGAGGPRARPAERPADTVPPGSRRVRPGPAPRRRSPARGRVHPLRLRLAQHAGVSSVRGDQVRLPARAAPGPQRAGSVGVTSARRPAR